MPYVPELRLYIAAAILATAGESSSQPIVDTLDPDRTRKLRVEEFSQQMAVLVAKANEQIRLQGHTFTSASLFEAAESDQNWFNTWRQLGASRKDRVNSENLVRSYQIRTVLQEMFKIDIPFVYSYPESHWAAEVRDGSYNATYQVTLDDGTWCKFHTPYALSAGVYFLSALVAAEENAPTKNQPNRQESILGLREVAKNIGLHCNKLDGGVLSSKYLELLDDLRPRLQRNARMQVDASKAAAVAERRRREGEATEKVEAQERLLQEEESRRLAQLELQRQETARQQREREAAKKAAARRGYLAAYSEIRTLDDIRLFEKFFFGDDPDGLIKKLGPRKSRLELEEYRAEFRDADKAVFLKLFIEKYRNKDPDGLVPLAERKLVNALATEKLAAAEKVKRDEAADMSRRQRQAELDVVECKRTVAAAQHIIAREREIAAVSGYENKTTLYQAGRTVVNCQNQIRSSFATYKSNGGTKSLDQIQ